jgi:hypothetical protein
VDLTTLIENMTLAYQNVTRSASSCANNWLTRDQTVPIDVENGRSGGKTTIIVCPEHYQHAKLTIAEFCGLTKQPITINPMEVENDDDMATYSNK